AVTGLLAVEHPVVLPIDAAVCRAGEIAEPAACDPPQAATVEKFLDLDDPPVESQRKGGCMKNPGVIGFGGQLPYHVTGQRIAMIIPAITETIAELPDAWRAFIGQHHLVSRLSGGPMITGRMPMTRSQKCDLHVCIRPFSK